MSADFLNRIHLGDCVAGLNALPAEIVDLAFADPPFNIGYKYDVYDDRREHEHYLDWSRGWIAAVHRVLKPNGTFWLAIGDEYAAELKLMSQELGFHTRSWVVWYYTFGVNCKNKFTRSHAHLFYFVKNPTSFTFRGDAPENRIPSARQLVYNDTRANPKGRLPDDTWILRPQDLTDCFQAEEDTWYFPRVAGTFKERAGFHGCQMPEQLLGRIVRSCSHEGDLVLDPFSGSATTLVTAKKLGRDFIGFELSPDYAERGGRRVEEAVVGAPLVGSADPTRSAPRTPGLAPAEAAEEVVSVTDEAIVEVAQPVEPAAEIVAPEIAAPEVAEPEALPVVVANGEAELIEHDPQRNLVEAFRRACHGYSPDRVMADPKLQAAFVEHCRALHVPGDVRSWNATLFRLRKAGKLKGVPTTMPTELAWSACEPFAFGAEIGVAKMSAAHPQVGIDELLCDPALAAEFDNVAMKFGGSKKAFEYRWTALKLRKEAKQLRVRAEQLKKTEPEFATPLRVAGKRWEKGIPEAPGLYLILNAEGERLYIGATTDLRARLVKQLASARLRLYDRSGDIRVALWPIERPFTDLLALQYRVVGESHARLNRPLPREPEPAPLDATKPSAKARPRREKLLV
ncbi:MAG: site-specific DNA-methyltransferase [Planctomycetia bacterium]|nr:site-specific DNA-methyltransferase [Planctomycetia bacterium]